MCPIDEKLIEAVIPELDRINELEDKEEQGYQAAKLLVDISGNTPEELLESIVGVGVGEENQDNIKRHIGAVRWCLEQRAVK